MVQLNNMEQCSTKQMSVSELNPGQWIYKNTRHVAALLLTGLMHYSEGRIDPAKKVLEGLADMNLHNPHVHAILGAIYQKEGRYDLAISQYTLAVGICPEDINSLANRGQVYLKLGKFEEAADDFKKAIVLDPEKKHSGANFARLILAMIQEMLKTTRANVATAY